MLRRLPVVSVLGLLGLGALVGVLYAGNPAPTVPALSGLDAERTDSPFVVKLHAQWCPKCMLTKGVWAEVEAAYAGRVRFVVFDFTSDATMAATEREARRIGLGSVFDEFAGETGTVLVVNGESRRVIDSIHGSRDVAEYQRAIDAALTPVKP